METGSLDKTYINEKRGVFEVLSFLKQIKKGTSEESQRLSRITSSCSNLLQPEVKSIVVELVSVHPQTFAVPLQCGSMDIWWVDTISHTLSRHLWS